MGLKCRIKFNDAGVATVLNNDGSPSSLYQDLLSQVKDQKTAMNIWASASLPEFEIQTGKDVDTASVEEVLTYYNFKGRENKNLSDVEKADISQFMMSNGYSSLIDLQADLKSVFNSDNGYRIDKLKALAFGYTQEDIDNLNVESVITLSTKIENFLSEGKDIILPSEDSQVKYVDESKITIFGTKSVIPEESIYSEILQSLGNGLTVQEAVNNLPYSNFVDSYNNSPSFKSRVDLKFSNIKIVPTVYIVDGQLTRANSSKVEEVRNTLIDNADVISIGADLEYLQDIDPDVWDFKIESIREVIKEIEETFAQSNIDIIGLNSFVSQRENVLDLISKGLNMTQTTSDASIIEFSEAYNSIFGTSNEVQGIKLPTVYKNLQIVRVNSALNDSELFRQFKLIKIADGLYHKVSDTPNSDLYEYIYRNIEQLELPVEIDVNDKLQSIINSENYVNSLPSNFDSDISESVRLNQIVFRHEPLPISDKTAGLNLINSDPGYLRNGFISDFYNYILSEKLNDSEVYRNVLSKFSVRENDIILTGEIASIEGILLQEELEDYIRLKKDSSMDFLLPPKTMEFVDEDLFYLNNPSTVQEIEDEYRRERDYLIARTSPDNWVKVGKEVFRKVSSKGGTDVFLSIKAPQNNIYFNTSTNFDFNTSEAIEVLNRNQFSEKEVNSESLQDKASDKTHLQRDTLTSKDMTMLLANYVKTALGYDVNVLTRDQMLRQLESRGYTQLFKTGETVYGFYDNSTKQIMLTDDLLNTSTFMHELWHMYKPIVKDQSFKGDITAKALLQKFDSIVSDLFNEDEFNQRFDKFLGKDNLNFNEDFQVIGEIGLLNLTESEQERHNLALAKQLKEEGEDEVKIKNATGWELLNNEWVMEVPDLKLKVDEVELGKIYKLSEVVEDNNLIQAYGDIDIQFNDQGVNSYSPTEAIIRLDSNGRPTDNIDGAFNSISTTFNETRYIDRLKASNSLAHEFMHHVQAKEGFLQGSSYVHIVKKAFELAGIREDDSIATVINRLSVTLDETTEYSSRQILEAALNYAQSFYKDNSWATEAYTRTTGEVTARAVQSRFNLSEEDKANSLIKYSMDTPEWYRINFKSADLQASVYDPRQGESREDYISRMKEEIEANLIGQNSEEYFENIAKETGLTEEQTKSFLQRLRDFIDEFSQWLANKLGFKALTPEQAANLTTKDFLDRVTTSILKDDYSQKVNNLQQILDSDLKVVYLYPESQDNQIKQEIDSCG